MLEKIQELNKNITLLTTESNIFKQYGRKLNYDCTEFIDKLSSQKELDEIKNSTKANYIPDIEELHEFNIFKKIKKDIFGYLPIQIGIVKGRNQSATGTEYHLGSEVNIAITDCILVLGKKDNLVNDSIDISDMDLFYIKKGEVFEIFSTTLHYTPIEINDSGFSLAVILLQGTNTDIEFEKNSMLCKKNKWYICHPSQKEKIKQGFKVGLLGELLTIKHK